LRKKILYFIKTPPPVHGGTIMNQTVYDSKLLRNSYNVRAITVHYVECVKELGILSLKKFIKTINIFFKLLRELIFYRPDLIYFQISHLGGAFIRDMIFVLLIKFFRIKIVYHLHGKGIYNITKNSKFMRSLYKFVFHNSFVICLSKLLVGDIENVFKGKVFIVNNAITFNNKLSYKKIHNNSVNILFLSNLIISKGILDFIDSLEILSSREIIFNAKIIGAESEITKEKLNSILIKKNLADTVKYIGPLYGEEKAIELINSDIFVFPTYYHNETWGLVLLEAMQAGLPLISTYEGAIPEIIDDGETGFLVNKQNPKQLAEKLEILIKDKELRILMGQKAKEKYYNKYTVDIFENNMKIVFNEILTSK
jgi:glycosyltransferase involved in cell wall biosynthesis